MTLRDILRIKLFNYSIIIKNYAYICGKIEYHGADDEKIPGRITDF